MNFVVPDKPETTGKTHQQITIKKHEEKEKP